MAHEVAVVITSFNQGEFVAEAVASVLRQTSPAAELVVVDDGTTDARSVDALDQLVSQGVRVLRQANAGVSAARNAGIAATESPLVAVLDGDDAWEPDFLAATVRLLAAPDVVIASSWLRMHGVAEGVVQPPGGEAVSFLHRNAAPASAVFRRSRWQQVGGYDESMRRGFEDWNFFLALLADGGRADIVPAPLLNYRTAPASANITSMNVRPELYGHIIDTHHTLFAAHMREVLLALDEASADRLKQWEALAAIDPNMPVGEASYGDGGMAAHVRIATARAKLRNLPGR